jgi:hypothetical protein
MREKARRGKTIKWSIFACEIIKLNTKSVSPDSNLNQNLYIYFLSSGQVSKQAEPYPACLLAQNRLFSLLACLISKQASKPS